MHRLLNRLDRNLSWNLLAPESASKGPEHPTPTAERRADWLEQIELVRARVSGLAPEPQEPELRFSSAGAWHLMAIDKSGAIAGAVRLHVIDRRLESLEPEDILRFGHVLFSSEAERSAHLLALRLHFKAKAHEPIFVCAAGLFTTRPWRGSGLAAVFGAAAIAMARLQTSRFSVSFTAARDRAPELFERLGGTPLLLPDGQVLGPFVCGHHGVPVQLLSFDSALPGLFAEDAVQAVAGRLQALMGGASSQRRTVATQEQTA